MISKIFKKKLFPGKTNRGFTYVELIVVLSIFGIMSAISFFKYSDFQDLVEIENTAQNIALQIVGAQKMALSGKLPLVVGSEVLIPDWRPAYGVYFEITNKTRFIPFVDVNNDFLYNNACNDILHPGGTLDDCMDVISINKGIKIANLKCLGDPGNVCSNNVSITFKRPDSGAFISSDGVNFYPQLDIKITNSTESIYRTITVYASGRVEVR